MSQNETSNTDKVNCSVINCVVMHLLNEFDRMFVLYLNYYSVSARKYAYARSNMFKRIFNN